MSGPTRSQGASSASRDRPRRRRPGGRGIPGVDVQRRLGRRRHRQRAPRLQPQLLERRRRLPPVGQALPAGRRRGRLERQPPQPGHRRPRLQRDRPDHRGRVAGGRHGLDEGSRRRVIRASWSR